MEQKADTRPPSKGEKKPIAIRKLVAIIVLGVVLLGSLLAFGYFGVMTLHRSQQRREALAAYENGDYEKAERLLQQYVAKDRNSEPEFVALANIYHSFGNTGLEAQMWQTASSLNPLNAEYRENMLISAARSASYGLLHGILGRKARVDEEFTELELYLYVIASYRADYPKDADEAYKKAVEKDPEAFHANELGRMAEFMATYGSLSEIERDVFLSQAMKSEDPVIRFEAVYTAICRAAQLDDNETDYENLLKQAAEVNYFAGAPLLADYYFSVFRFADAISILEPYLEKIDDVSLYLLYAESCVFEGKLDELKALEKKLSRKQEPITPMAKYCEILIAFLENDEENLSAALRKSGKLINSPLSRFIHLRVAMANDSFNEIRTVVQEIFSYPPFHDLHNRALVICLDYISRELQKPENQEDPSRLVDLAKVLTGYLQGNRMLTEIIIMDQYKKDLLNEAELQAALEQFPDDALLLRIDIEFLILNGKADQAMSIIDQILAALEEAGQEPDRGIQTLRLLALEQTGQYDEAAAAFQELVEQSEFDLDLLNKYFQFCVKNKRSDDLLSMAGKLDSVKDGKLEHFGKIFRAADLLATEEENKENEALKLLAATPNDDPDFTFYAANRLFEYEWFDEAEAKYNAILKTYKTPVLILVNLSELYHARGDETKAMQKAKEAYDMEKRSSLPGFVYAKRLSEAGRYEEAVEALRFPRHAVTNYREDVVELWTDCMKHVIEKSLADRRFMQAEEQCKHLLLIVPDDAFGKETLEKVREILFPKKDNGGESEEGVPAA